MSHSKPLLIPWLRAEIDSAKYPGVFWTNPERTEFSIPWKHALRQDSCNTDVLIFKAWAEVSGGGRAHGEPSVWKRNFRSALRVKGFQMVSDDKNDAANPHKVFRWPGDPPPGANSSAGTQDQSYPDLLADCHSPTQESQPVQCFEEGLLYAGKEPLAVSLACVRYFRSYGESAANQDILQECLRGLNISLQEEGCADYGPLPENQLLLNQVVTDALPGQQQYPVMLEGAIAEVGLPEQAASSMEGAVGGGCDGELVDHFLETMSKAKDGENFKTHFRISVYYRGVLVSEQLVENECGIRLVYRPELDGIVLDHESGLSLVSLPSPGAMLDQTQAKLTQKILDGLGDGLDVGVSGCVVYCHRRGIKTFWSFSKYDRSNQTQEVPKLEPQPLFQFQGFVREILDFINGGKSPHCSLFFCLGEKWPDPENKPWERKLITVEVVLTSMEVLKNIAVAGGASSLQSLDLQMSLEEMMEM
ncbi:interferon regulatory factor 3 isoform X1 [Gasterosteus aculeatus]